MAYQKQTWNNYNDSLSIEQNKANNAFATPEGLNHIETGIEQVEFSLNQQLAESASSKVDKNGNEQVSMGMLAPDIKAALSGGNWNVNVNTSEIEKKAVTPSKIFMPLGYLPLGLSYTKEATDHARAESDAFTVNGITTINSLGTNISFGVSEMNGEVGSLITKGWAKFFELSQNKTYKIRAKFDDNSLVTGREVEFETKIEVKTPKTAVKSEEIKSYFPISVTLERGGISGLDGSSGAASLTQYRNLSFLEMPANSTLILNDKSTYMIAYFIEGKSGFYGGGWIREDLEVATNSRVRFMIKRADGGNITPGDEIGQVTFFTEKMFAQRKHLSSGSQKESKIIKYVSVSGSDANSGNESNPYETLQKALNDKPNKIYIERGVYYNQTASMNNLKDMTIEAYGAENYSHESPADKKFAEFRGSDVLTGWVPYNGIHRTPYSGNAFFQDVFVSKSKPVETGGNRSSYNAVLWEGNDNVNDYKMKPVLTLSECESEVGTFFYDGTHIYINAKDITSEFNAIRTMDGLSLSGSGITLTDIHFCFYHRDPFNLDNTSVLTVQRCKSSHSGTSDGFSLDCATGKLYDSEAYKNRNDGFNMHYFGDTQLFNCKGINNYDDGVSHHEACTGAIYGGEWSGNGKGGISPVNNSKINVYNAVVEDNAFSLWNNTNPGITTIYNSCLFKDNAGGIKNTLGGKVITINCIFENNGANDIKIGDLVSY